MVLKIDAKLERKLTRAFKNDMKNLANFHEILLSRVCIYSGELLVTTMKNEAKFKEELT